MFIRILRWGLRRSALDRVLREGVPELVGAEWISEGWKRKAVESWKKSVLGQGNRRCKNAQAGFLHLSTFDILAR